MIFFGLTAHVSTWRSKGTVRPKLFRPKRNSFLDDRAIIM